MRQKILTEGCGLEVENAMIDAINKRKLNWPDFFYTEEKQRYACRIGDFEFKLIHTSEEWCKAWCDKHKAYEDIDVTIQSPLLRPT